jgi:tRNA-modifying protein YgfZ
MTSGNQAASDEQYHALRDGRGFVQLAAWSSVTVTGADRQTFLHNFCTNDVRRLAPGRSCEAFFTNVKGKILGHGLVSCRENELVIVTVPGQVAPLIEHLERYVIREDLAVRDTMAERRYFLVSDGKLVDDAAMLWMPWNLIGRPTSGLIEAPAGNSSRVKETLVAQQSMPCNLATFEKLRIEAGMPLFGFDFNDTNLPQEVGRDAVAISFTKGCYLGQETVARLDALGHVNQKIAGVQFGRADVPATGTELIRNGKSVGHVTSATFSPRRRAPLALGMLRREALAPGTELESAAGAARVVSLPVGDANS